MSTILPVKIEVLKNRQFAGLPFCRFAAVPDVRHILENFKLFQGIPELREYIKDFDFLVLSSDSYGFFLTLIILITLVTATSLTFAWLLHANIRDRAGNNASKRTVQLQQIFFRAILIQVS